MKWPDFSFWCDNMELRINGHILRFHALGAKMGGPVEATTCGTSCHKTAYPDESVSLTHNHKKQTSLNDTVWAVRAAGPGSGFGPKRGIYLLRRAKWYNKTIHRGKIFGQVGYKKSADSHIFGRVAARTSKRPNRPVEKSKVSVYHEIQLAGVKFPAKDTHSVLNGPPARHRPTRPIWVLADFLP